MEPATAHVPLVPTCKMPSPYKIGVVGSDVLGCSRSSVDTDVHLNKRIGAKLGAAYRYSC